MSTVSTHLPNYFRKTFFKGEMILFPSILLLESNDRQDNFDVPHHEYAAVQCHESSVCNVSFFSRVPKWIIGMEQSLRSTGHPSSCSRDLILVKRALENGFPLIGFDVFEWPCQVFRLAKLRSRQNGVGVRGRNVNSILWMLETRNNFKHD